MGEPYADVGGHLRDELRRAWLRVEYQIRLGWTKGPPTQISDGVVAPDDMGRLFAAARGETVASDEAGATTVLQQWLELHRNVEARIKASLETKAIRSPMVELYRAFQLTPRQWSTLMFALLPEVDPNLVHGYRYLSRDANCRGLDARLLAQLVYDTPQTRSLMARDLSATSPLVKYRLVDLAGAGPLDSQMFRKIRAATRLVYLLDGTKLTLDPELAELAEVRGGVVSGSFPELAIDRAKAALHSSEVVLAVQGQRGLGKKLLLQIAAAHQNKQLVIIDAKRVAALPLATQQATIRAITRELVLLDAVPVVADADDAVVKDGARDVLPPFFDALLDEWHGSVAITFNRERMPRMHRRPLVHITVDVPGLAVRTTMWRDVVPSLGEADAASLSGRFAIPGGIIVAAAQAATAGRMPDAGPPGALELEQAVAAQLHQRISRLGKKLPTPYDLDDLIVDDDTRGAILEIVAAARQRRVIRDQFKLRGAQGISVLFSGHPGVGKTMSGTVLAKRLGLGT